ncbi:uncharacterized protein LOC143040599 isoform X2 [Oratosquilla oratoria]|uniref:uncharacterized protein LOC143040599 isoform X2 n=1 Tax=Oratosquilla oratoria TaxID=337810 RepID=UPI003F76B7FC
MKGENKSKKSFDKRAYLKKKFKRNFGSQQEGHGRAYLQKKAVMQRYMRDQKKEDRLKQRKEHVDVASEDGAGSTSKEVPKFVHPLLQDDVPEELPDTEEETGRKKKLSKWQKAQQEYDKKQEEKRNKREAAEKRRQEMELAKKKYQEKRLHRFKQLSKKTKKGQPKMSARIELLLEKIQEDIGPGE